MSDEFPEILSAYLDGELSPAEMVRFEQELLASPQLQSQFEALRRIQSSFQAMPHITPPVNFLDKISLQFDQSIPETKENKASTSSHNFKTEIVRSTVETLTRKSQRSAWGLTTMLTSVCAVVVAVSVSYWSIKQQRANRDSAISSNINTEALDRLSNSMERNDFNTFAVPPQAATPAVVAGSDTAQGASNSPSNQAGLLVPNYVVTWQSENSVYLTDAPKEDDELPQSKQEFAVEIQENRVSSNNNIVAFNEPNLIQIGNRGLTITNSDYALRYVLYDHENTVEQLPEYNKKVTDHIAKNADEEKFNSTVTLNDSKLEKNKHPDKNNSSFSYSDSLPSESKKEMAAGHNPDQIGNTNSPLTMFNTLVNVEVPDDQILVLKVDVAGDITQLKELEDILARNNIVPNLNELGLQTESETFNQPFIANPIPASNAVPGTKTDGQTNQSVNELSVNKQNQPAEGIPADSQPVTGKDAEQNRSVMVTQGVYVDATSIQLEQTFSDLLAHKNVKEMEVSLAHVPSNMNQSAGKAQAPSNTVELRSANTVPNEDAKQATKATITEENSSKVFPKDPTGNTAGAEIKSMQKTGERPRSINSVPATPDQQANTTAGSQTRVEVFRSQTVNRGSTQAQQQSINRFENPNLQQRDQSTPPPLSETNIPSLNETPHHLYDKKMIEPEFKSPEKSKLSKEAVIEKSPDKNRTISLNNQAQQLKTNSRKLLIIFEQRAVVEDKLKHRPPAPALPD